MSIPDFKKGDELTITIKAIANEDSDFNTSYIFIDHPTERYESLEKHLPGMSIVAEKPKWKAPTARRSIVILNEHVGEVSYMNIGKNWRATLSIWSAKELETKVNEYGHEVIYQWSPGDHS